MMFDRPVSFAEAVAFMRRKKIFPTDMTTQELRELDAAFREQAFFSAQNVFEDVLTIQKQVIESILSPKRVMRADRVAPGNPQGWVTEGFNPATARVEIKRALDRIGYSPELDERGTIKDLSSDARMNLVVDTNERLARGYGFKRVGETPALLKTRPGWELYRQEDRVKVRDWLTRFRVAGELTGDPIGTGWVITPGGQMLGMKGHAIWEQLGSSANFDDALDVSYPPFAFNSGMWVRDVTREDCDKAGLKDVETRRGADQGFKTVKRASTEVAS